MIVQTCNELLKENIQEKLREQGIHEKYPQRVVRYLITQFDKVIFTYSGGRDSTLLLLLLAEDNLLEKIDYIIFNNTRMNSKHTLDYIDQVIDTLEVREKFVVVKPKMTRRELLVIIEEDIIKAKGKKHSKDLYRCCRLAKEKPFNLWLKENNYSNEKTVVIRGLRANESSQRYMSFLQMIETGQIYFNKPRYNRKIFVSNPLILLDNNNKKRLLEKLTIKYRLTLPNKSGCNECPIFNRFEKGYDKRRIRIDDLLYKEKK